MMVVVIDNYDSFTYNIVQQVGEFTSNIHVFKNDEVTIEALTDLNPSHIVISPGPGLPKDAGLSIEVIKVFLNKSSILGVCLGFQALAWVLGAKIKQAPKLFHGKTSPVDYSPRGLFNGITGSLEVMRYHSWMIQQTSEFLKSADIIAWTKDEIPMALQHKTLPVFGVQFHPESILTKQGRTMIKNFLEH